MGRLLGFVFVATLVFNENLFVSSEETVEASTPSGLVDDMPKLPMEGGGTVVASVASTVQPAPVLPHTLSDALLETEGEGTSPKKSSSIVARKGAPAPPEAPGVAEEDGNADVQSLFADETKHNGSAVSICSNSTLQGNASGNNCSQNEHDDKSSQMTYGTTTTIAEVTSVNNSDSTTETLSVNATVSKPVTLHALVTSGTGNGAVNNSSAALNSSHNSSQKKKLKPETTLGVDESKEEPLATDTPPSKGDYIIPIIGIILAVPMVVILFMFFYKRSAEFWERRHYKRMDFLIDGMYND